MKIIQIGANNGKDHVFDLINDNKDSLELAILVEPIPFIIDELKNQYKDINNIVIENIAITQDEDLNSMDLYYLKDSNYEVSSFSKHHVINHKPKGSTYELNSLSVPCMTINKLMEKHNIQTLDYLFIDTEGLDVHIIASFDFNKYKVKDIIFESVHTDGVFSRNKNFQQLSEYLDQLGYEVSFIDDLNVKASYRN
jgi:FkbM family methyltransferase